MGVEFHEGINHGHEPCGKWSEIQKNPNSPGNPMWVEDLCKQFSPKWFIKIIRQRQAWNPLADKHIDWYLEKGKGRDFDENKALEIALERDSGIRGAISRRLRKMSSGKYTDFFKLEQKHYNLDDVKNSWGAIDRLDFEADFDAGTLHAWFKDRYEWHPYYPGLYIAHEDDIARETNCVHAAFVEMKNEGAADFWMVGEATVPLKLFTDFKQGDWDWGSRADY